MPASPASFNNSFRLTTPSAKPPVSSVSDSLKQLLDHSRQLQAGIANSANPHNTSFNPLASGGHSSSAFSNGLPTVQLGLDQIESQSRRLISKLRKNDHLDSTSSPYNNGHGTPGRDVRTISSLNGQGPSSKAHYILASAGVNADELGKTIDAVDLRGTFEPLQPLQDTDVEVSRVHHAFNRCTDRIFLCATFPTCFSYRDISNMNMNNLSSRPSKRVVARQCKTSIKF